MDMRQLKYLAAICRLKSLSHAADHCNVAASALSHHIANLEAELGTQLFERKPRGMEPTAAGLKLLHHAQSILAAVEAAVEDIRDGQAEVSGEITIGMPYSVIKVIGAGLMRTVLNDYAKVRLLLREALSGTTHATLKERTLDLALIFNPPAETHTEREPLLTEELFCIGAPSIIGRDPAPITFDEMAKLPVMLLQSGVLSRALVDKPGALARLEAAARIQLASVAATQAALVEGIGLHPRAEGAGPGTACHRPGSRAPRNRSSPDPDPLHGDQSRRPANSGCERMSALIRDLVRDAIAEGRWQAARSLS
jgi:LysR family transcriptional regulator, nitrogen assimilation regulatory protein